jgi:hypothetical protein
MNKPKYTGLGIALGAALGAVAGVMAGHVAIWLGIGVAIGMVLGSTFRRKPTECPQCAQIHRAHETKNRTENQKLAAGS